MLDITAKCGEQLRACDNFCVWSCHSYVLVPVLFISLQLAQR